MSKTKISDYSSTPANNTDIGGINIAEGMLPSDVNNAIREQMAQLKNFQSGASGESVTFATVRIVTSINDTNGNEVFGITATGSAVNELTVANAATGNNPTISATGSDTNIGIVLSPKGTGGVVFPAGAVGTPAITTSGDTNTGIYFPAADTIAFAEGGAEAMRIDSSGNLGLGVVPSAWAGSTALQVGQSGVVESRSTSSALFGSNYYWDGAANRYRSTETAATISISGADFRFFQAPSGTAGNAITFTQAMTLDASGNLLVGTTSASALSAAGRGLTELNGSSDSVYSYKAGGNLVGYTLGSASEVRLASFTAIPLTFYTNATERARITSGGNFKIGGSADRATTEGDKQLVLFNGTAPVGTLANGVSFYSASGEANVMDAAGNATLLSPHDAVTNEWIFRSKHTPTGKVLKIDVERLLKFVNDHFGLDAVHEFIED